MRNKVNLSDLIAATSIAILLKLDSNYRYFGPYDLKTWWMMTSRNNRSPLLCYAKLCATFQSHWWIQTVVTVRKLPIRVKIVYFLSRMTLKFGGWPRKRIGHLFYATSSVVRRIISIGELKLEVQFGNAKLGSNVAILCPMLYSNLTDDLKNKRSPLLCHIKIFALFHPHMWVQTGVMVRKWLNGVLTSVTLTFDLWPWSFAWTSLLQMVLTENWKFHNDTMMGTWWKRCDGWTDWTIHGALWTQLK